MKENFEYLGLWWSDKETELVKIDGKIYALYGWNGEHYNSCWEVAENLIDVIDEKQEYTIAPIHEEVEEDEFEIVGYDVSMN